MKRFGSTVRIVLIIVSVIVVVGAGVSAVIIMGDEPPTPEGTKNVKVSETVSGHKVEIKPEGHLVYAGIQAPYPKEPFGKEALELNRTLVEGKTVRLRFDESPKDRKDRWLAYVFVDGEFVNRRLVAEGLAYVRLKEGEQRFAKELLAAQMEARAARRGIWSIPIEETERQYPGGRNYASFHRPDCEDLAKTTPANKVMFASKSEAFNAGFVPCRHCNP